MTPILHCRCKICVRSMIAEKNNQAAMAMGSGMDAHSIPISHDRSVGTNQTPTHETAELNHDGLIQIQIPEGDADDEELLRLAEEGVEDHKPD